ncbi:MAG: hypothetical protein QME76_03225 [Bacillota bacterium]|nr:hypothetical protein [Bacillota bacterium]
MWSRLSRRERVLVVLAVAVLVGFLGYRCLCTGLAAQWNGTFAELAQARKELAAARAAQDGLPAEKERLAGARETYQRARADFRNNVADGGAVVKLGLAAIETGVTITGYHAMGLVADKHYLALPVVLEVRGPYPDVLTFLARIEERRDVPALVAVRRLAIEQNKDDTGNAAGTVDGRFTLVFYAEPTAGGRLALAEIAGWKVGRPDGFAPAGAESPYPGVPVTIPPPPVQQPAGGDSSGTEGHLLPGATGGSIPSLPVP